MLESPVILRGPPNGCNNLCFLKKEKKRSDSVRPMLHVWKEDFLVCVYFEGKHETRLSGGAVGIRIPQVGDLITEVPDSD